VTVRKPPRNGRTSTAPSSELRLAGEEIATLKRAREVAQKIEMGLERREGTSDRLYPMGRLAEACRAADEAVMQILILGNVHGFGVSEEDLHQ